MFAGGGEGAVWHPRVGVEVIVEFLEGDPDRPIVTGRVYNGAKIPPAPSVGSPTISTWKSFSVPGGAQYNEIMFDDAAGSEEIRMHAGRDWNTVVERNRTELVKADSASTVGVNRTEATGRDRTTSVGANNTETVVENEMIGIGGNQALTVAQNQAVTVGMNQTTVIDGWQKIDIEGSQGLDIHNGNQSVNVKGWMDYATEASATLHARHDVGITADDVVRVSGRNVVAIDSSQGVVTVNGADLVKLESPMLIEIKGGDILVTGGSISIRGEPIDIESTGNVMINGDQVKLNC
jgi:type VI secretion system secreted protein VgrG